MTLCQKYLAESALRLSSTPRYSQISPPLPPAAPQSGLQHTRLPAPAAPAQPPAAPETSARVPPAALRSHTQCPPTLPPLRPQTPSPTSSPPGSPDIPACDPKMDSHVLAADNVFSVHQASPLPSPFTTTTTHLGQQRHGRISEIKSRVCPSDLFHSKITLSYTIMLAVCPFLYARTRITHIPSQSRILPLRLASVRYASTSLRDRVAKLIPEQLEIVISHLPLSLIHPFAFRSRLPALPMAKKLLVPSRSTSSTGKYIMTNYLLL